MSAASRTSVVVSSKIAESTSAPLSARAARGASYESSFWLPIAAWKIDGFVVTPETLRDEIRSARFPEAMRARERSSSQMLTPASTSCWVGVEPEVGVLMRSP